MASSPAHSSASSGDTSDASQPASIAVVQTVNIRSHVPILLDLLDSNYSQWRCCFDSVPGKFGLDDIVKTPTPMAQRDAEWRQINCCIVNWLYTTVNKNVFDIIYKPRSPRSPFGRTSRASSVTMNSSAPSTWRLSSAASTRAVYLEAEFRSLN